MIDTFKESIMSTEDAAKHIAKITGSKSNRNLILRWMNRGVSGVVLASVRIGSEIYTSREKLNLFLNESRRVKRDKLSKATKAGIEARKGNNELAEIEADELGI